MITLNMQQKKNTNHNCYRLIVTSGPTREWIDPVRFISNPASGRTGWHLAQAAVTERRHLFDEVVYISGPTEMAYRKVAQVKNVNVETTVEMCDAVHAHLREHCVLIMAAAPTDYKPREFYNNKLKKQDQNENITLHWTPTVDILRSLLKSEIEKKYTDLYRIGFAAETSFLLENAAKKLDAKKLDMICANQVYKDISGFGDNQNTLHIITKAAPHKKHVLGPASKAELALYLLDFIINHLLPVSSAVLPRSHSIKAEHSHHT